jgi:hypothetical protein
MMATKKHLGGRWILFLHQSINSLTGRAQWIMIDSFDPKPATFKRLFDKKPKP